MDGGRLRIVGAVLAMVGSLLAGCETVDGLKRDVGLDERVPPLKFASEPDVRIRIARDQTQIKLSGPSQLVVRPLGASNAELVGGPLTITCGVSGFTVIDGLQRKKTFAPGLDLEVLAGDPKTPDSATSALASEALTVNTTKYPGFVALRGKWGQSAGRFDVVVDMPVEAYLPGVLTHELFPDWPSQAYEAQAVASRTYALHERDRARSEGRVFDLEASDADQVFGGQTKSLRASEAVRTTRGQVLTYNGRLIRAYFSSQCGGRPGSARWSWSGEPEHDFNLVKPLQGSKRTAYCQQSPLYRWNVTRTDDDVTQRFRAYGRSIKADFGIVQRVREIAVIDRNEAGRPNRYRVTDVTGASYEMSPEQVRVGANYAASSLPPITKETRVNSGDVEVEVWATQVRFNGRGWGHGVGMCQYCAKGMAQQGMDWPTMIRAFYPGARVVKAYD